MSSDVNLVRAHFESALATLAQLKDFKSVEDQAHLLEVAQIAHGAGARRLGRICGEPWMHQELLALHQFEERVRMAIARAERDEFTTPYFMLPLAQ
ncbi:MAG TPA: hypothetical protein VM686_14275 [Polyangiaceae bacterium]|nr:hypothetical protein [Polyangiaceae bacterium]